MKRGQKAADQLNNDERVKGNGKVVFKQLDLASFESIRKFVDEINNEEDVIDMLINNAGLYSETKQLTKDGLAIWCQSFWSIFADTFAIGQIEEVIINCQNH